jgi:signal peptidase I
MSSAPIAATPHFESPAPTEGAACHQRPFAAVRRAAPAVGWLVLFAVVALLLLPTALGYSRYAIVGGSMSPAFERGSAVYSEPVAVEALQIGDVITYVPPPRTGIDTLVTHRIVEITRTEDGSPLFRTQGDANDAVDPWTFTLDSDHQNVVRFSVPHLGTVLTHLARPDVRQIVIGIPAGLIALGAVLDLFGVTSLRRLVGRRRR